MDDETRIEQMKRMIGYFEIMLIAQARGPVMTCYPFESVKSA